jgi:hypothetical protein
MRSVLLAAIGMALAACSAEPAPEQAASNAAPPVQAAVTSTTENAVVAPTAAAPLPEVEAPPVARASAPRPDYSRRERRLTALIENASVRDPAGDVQRQAQAARAARARCATAACIEQSYAAQEASLRQWEGADEVMLEFGAL